MANRVRFLSLVLGGFGRYDRPTRFSLSGRSCTFTSANELGKSTFQAGLLSTLFGAPAVRARAAAFQSRHRSWNGPIAFFGELDLTVNDERWRIRQDFDALETKVWRLAESGPDELRLHVKAKSSRASVDPEPYARLLQDWLGVSEMSFYEAMFTVSQESTLSTAWQIDPRIASLVYGPSVERLQHSLMDLFGRFRDITRNTREYQIAVGSQGERNGRSDGRLDEVIARIEALQANLIVARDRATAVVANRSQVQEITARLDELRARESEALNSLQAWRDWMELESRLKPAVDSYHRLRDLNERCQQVTRPLAEMRNRLFGELSVLDRAPADLPERLEYYPLLVQSANEAKQRHRAACQLRDELNGKLTQLEENSTAQFDNIRNRQSLADDIDELRMVQEELARVRDQLNELTSPNEIPDSEQLSWQRRRAELEPWGVLADLPKDQLEAIRRWIESFCVEHAEFEASQELMRVEARWLTDQEAALTRGIQERQELVRSRQCAADSMATAAMELRLSAERAHDARQKLGRATQDLAHRYIDFTGAPPDLPEQWDELRELNGRRDSEQERISVLSQSIRNMDLRVMWRRGLAGGGAVVAPICIALDYHWPGWAAALSAVGLAISLRWIYRVQPAEIAEQRRIRQRHEAELLRINKQRDELIARIAPFVVPAEREAEWRRLWPAYRRELERLEASERALPDAAQIAQWTEQAKELDRRLHRHNAESAELLAELDESQTRARAEYARRMAAQERTVEQLQAHVERYFGQSEQWQELSAQSLAAPWQPVVSLATADAPNIHSVSDLVRWCQSLDAGAWSRFRARCGELKELDSLLAPNPAAAAAREEAIRNTRDILTSLEQHELHLLDAITPFTATTDPHWIREQQTACAKVEQEIADLNLELMGLPDVNLLAEQVEGAEQELARGTEVLAPLLECFGHDLDRIASALTERSQLNDRVRQLEGEAQQLLAESGFNSLEELAHEAGKAEGLVGTIRGESQELIARAAELWQAVDAPAELASQRLAEFESLCRELHLNIETLERERAELVAMIRQMESDPSSDIASIETELALLCDEKAELEKTRDTIAAEFKEANRLLHELERVERTALEGRITAYFADFSRTAGRRVELDEDLRITVWNEVGTRYSPTQLSHGARDQLYLAVYLATTAGFDLPFILDDPFVNCDDERLAAIRACWDRLLPNHQLILLSHNPEMAGWAPALEMRDAA